MESRAIRPWLAGLLIVLALALGAAVIAGQASHHFTGITPSYLKH